MFFFKYNYNTYYTILLTNNNVYICYVGPIIKSFPCLTNRSNLLRPSKN